MTKVEFLNALEAGLTALPKEDAYKAMSFYSESIDDRVEDGMSEEEAVASLGDIAQIIRDIEEAQPIATIVRNKVRTSKDRSKNKGAWIALAICGSPLWIPLLIAFAAVVFSLYVAIWSVVVSVAAALVAFGIVGIVGIIAGVVLLIVSGIKNGMFIIGTACIALGLFILLAKPVAALGKAAVRLGAFILKKVKRLFLA